MMKDSIVNTSQRPRFTKDSTSPVGCPEQHEQRELIFDNRIKIQELPPTMDNEEACKFLKVSVSTLKRYRKQGLRSCKASSRKRSRVLFMTSDLLELLEGSFQQ